MQIRAHNHQTRVAFEKQLKNDSDRALDESAQKALFDLMAREDSAFSQLRVAGSNIWNPTTGEHLPLIENIELGKNEKITISTGGNTYLITCDLDKEVGQVFGLEKLVRVSLAANEAKIYHGSTKAYAYCRTTSDEKVKTATTLDNLSKRRQLLLQPSPETADGNVQRIDAGK